MQDVRSTELGTEFAEGLGTAPGTWELAPHDTATRLTRGAQFGTVVGPSPERRRGRCRALLQLFASQAMSCPKKKKKKKIFHHIQKAAVDRLSRYVVRTVESYPSESCCVGSSASWPTLQSKLENSPCVVLQ